MNVQEASEILQIIDQESKFSRQRTAEQLALRIKVWAHTFRDTPVNLVLAAALQAIEENANVSLSDVASIVKWIQTKQENKLVASEAWGMVQENVARWGYYNEPRALKSLPEAAAKAVKAIGWREICLCEVTQLNTIRAQFIKAFDSIHNRDSVEDKRKPLTENVKSLLSSITTSLPDMPYTKKGDK